MLAQTMSPMAGRTVVLMLMVVSTLVRLSEDLPRRSSALLAWFPIGGMRERMLNPALSFASAKDFVS